MATATKALPEHGTYARYRRKCRCDDCRAANSARAMEHYRRKKLGLPPDPKPVPECGTTAKYGRGCRCDECRSANATYERERLRANGVLPRDRHGALAKFKRGCRCAECVAANEEYLARAVERTREWRAENPTRAKVLDLAKSARRRGATVIEDVDPEVLWTGFCALCSESMDRDLPRGRSKSPTLDHIIPLSRGGQHTQDNLQWAHHGCNTRKGDQ